MDAIKVKLIGLSRGGGGNLQPDKTVTPTEQEQTVRPNPGYDGLRQVTVEAIPDQYADVSGVDAGAGDVRVGKVIVGSDGETITGTMPPQKPEEIGHATPTEQAQTVTPTAGSVFSAVEVEPIPSEYADVSSVDATAADVRTGKIIVDAQGNTITGEMEPQKPEQSKSVVPTVISQLVTPDPGYALSWVDVGAIPSEYADVSDVTATAGTVLTGSDFVDASGTLVHGACDYDADTSDADATAEQIEAGATAYVGGAKVTGTMPVRSADVEISDLSPVAIPAGSYDGTAKAKLSSAAAAEVVASNIRLGAEILKVRGTAMVNDLDAYLMNTLTEVVLPTTTRIPTTTFRGQNNILTIDAPSCLQIAGDALQRMSNLNSVNIPRCTTIGTSAFAFTTALKRLDLPSITSIGAASVTMTFQNSGVETIICGASYSNISGATVFKNAVNLTVLVLRCESVVNLSAIGNFENTPFASNGTGGMLYVPQDQIAEYQSATNWSVILAYPNNQILPIEGSPYEVTS